MRWCTALLVLAMPRLAFADEPAPVHVQSDGPSAPTSRVTRLEADERLARSTPEALHFEPGVFVQQTGHGQASPFVRGRTGQQTVILFDGIRLNNSTWRQGPNQYLFTIDVGSLAAIEVLRGGASTLYGSDAIGGVVHVRPLEPRVDEDRGLYLRPRARLRGGGADGEWSERFQLDAQLDPAWQILTGFGFRRLGPLRAGGPVRSPVTGEIPQVPAFEADGKTMLGTGFAELTADVRAVHQLSPTRRLVAATYLYRQYDAPRTDACPPAFAPRSECLRYDEQFRTLAYLAFEGALGPLPRARVVASYQRQHERRIGERPSGRARSGGRDDVDTFGIVATAAPHALVRPGVRLAVSFGADAYFDRIASTAWTQFTDLDLTLPLSRGQYLDGSRYATGGAWARVETELVELLAIRAGGRLGLVRAKADGEATSGSRPVDAAFTAHAASLSVELRAKPWLSLIASYDRSFRAPNLDDLTSRQQTGPGFQFENPDLRPEIADTFELGARLRTPRLLVEGWVFRSRVRDAILRAIRSAADCPPATPQCVGSWSRLQLVNTPGASTLDGFEVSVRYRPIEAVLARASVSYAYGRGPNAQDPGGPEVPLSRVAPLNGNLELRWGGSSGLWAGGGLRWAAAQTRLAPSDQSDARIPVGGTPGWWALDVRAGYRVDARLLFTVVLENVSDAAYRVHGSSINGPGRGVRVGMEAGL
ncbi:MAG: TonB-dependent receptor [Myxococcales bacterium]|nr:TonB-dependent receptor [Myxococcales bacterium]